MSGLEALSVVSRACLYVLLGLIGLLTLAVGWAQFGCLSGRPFQNPDGTADNWREQKIFYGIAWADLAIACPLSVTGLFLTYADPRHGLFVLSGVSVWLLWASVMTTVTSLRFEKPRITFAWLLVFPFGAIVGLAYLLWIFIHFEILYG